MIRSILLRVFSRFVVTSVFSLLICFQVTFAFDDPIIVDGIPSVYICPSGTIRIHGTDTIPQKGCTYKWTPSDYLSSDTVCSPLLIGFKSQLYILTKTDLLGNKTSDTLMVWVRDLTPLNFATDKDRCQGFVSIYAMGGFDQHDPIEPPIWRVKGEAQGKIINGQGTTVMNVLWDGSGEGIVQAELTYANSRCTQGGEHIATIIPRPGVSVTAMSSTKICPGTSVQLDAGEGYTTYHWSSGENTRFIQASTQGGYSVTITNKDGCENTSSPVEVTYHHVQPPIISGQSVMCLGEQVQLQALSGYMQYQWSDGKQGQTITILNAGTYSVTAIDNNGCSATSEQFTVRYHTISLQANTSVLDFGECQSNVNSLQTVTLYNKGKESITIQELDLDDIGLNFSFVNPKPTFPHRILVNDSLVIPIQFFAKDKGEYTSTIVYKVSEPCPQIGLLTVKGVVADTSLDILTTIPDTTFETGKDNVGIPIYAQILHPTNESISGLTFRAELRWKHSIFHNEHVISNGYIVSDSLTNDEQFVKVEIPNVTLTSSKTELTSIIGSTLASKSFFTKVKIDSYSWGSLPRPARTFSSNGSISLQTYCFPRNINVGNYYPTKVAIYPTPIQQHGTIGITTSITGKYAIEIFDFSGVLGKQTSVFVEKIGKTELEIDCSDLVAGVYPVVITTPAEVIRTLMTVLK